MEPKILHIILYICYLLFVAFVIIKIVKDTDNPSKALGYILLVIVLPIIGIILYFSIGVNYRKEKLYKRKIIKNREAFNLLKTRIYDISENRIEENKNIIGDELQTVKMLLKDSLSPLYTVSKTELLINGENKFKEVIPALKAAKNHIHIQYYIFSDDKIGNQIKDILIQKAKEGVTVRFIYDDFGSHGLNKRIVKELNEAGVLVACFYKIKFYAFANRMNYRNHRKIIIIDSTIGFVGGVNVDDKYINSPEYSTTKNIFWRDTHLKIMGEAVYGLQFTFINDWNFCASHFQINLEDTQQIIRYFNLKQYISDTGEFKDLHSKIILNEAVQIASSGPDSDQASIMLAYAGIIMSCKKRVYITTPYFIPNETILNAIKFASLSGIDVRLLVPYVSDSKVVNAAASAYYEDILKTGTRIFRYKRGFVHAKTIVADNNLAVIGSANMDTRSFDLNFEISALVFSQKINQQLYDAFMDDLEDSEEILLNKWKKRSKLEKVGSSFAKLISPLL